MDLQRLTCGNIKIPSKEIEKNWVLSKSTNNIQELYFAICDKKTDEMIGWYSISGIDFLNRKCRCGGVVIGDKRYRDGEAYTEAGNLAFQYVIEELNMNRMSATCLREHILPRANLEASLWTLEGIERQAIFKNGSYHDIFHFSILRNEFIQHYRNGDYERRAFIKRLSNIITRIKKELNQ